MVLPSLWCSGADTSSGGLDAVEAACADGIGPDVEDGSSEAFLGMQFQVCLECTGKEFLLVVAVRARLIGWLIG